MSLLQIVSKALGGLKGELVGKYYPLSKMTEQEQEQLIKASLCNGYTCTVPQWLLEHTFIELDLQL